MTHIEIFLIALALCVDSLVVSTASSLKSKMPLRRGLTMA
jgi:putative Mn2+ efflux pump MntP